MKKTTVTILLEEKELKEATNTKKIFEALKNGEKVSLILSLRKGREISEKVCLISKNEGRNKGYNVQWSESPKDGDKVEKNEVMTRDSLRDAIVSGKIMSIIERKKLKRLQWK